MSEEILMLKTTNRIYRVKIETTGRVIESDIPFLLGKLSEEVWRWARCHLAKVYNGNFLPKNMVN